MQRLKKVEWVNSAKKDLAEFPDEMKGLGSGVIEIVSDYDTNTYRAVYVVSIGEKIYVLHCFQKKSKRGIETPKEEINMIKQRLKGLLRGLS